MGNGEEVLVGKGRSDSWREKEEDSAESAGRTDSIFGPPFWAPSGAQMAPL